MSRTFLAFVLLATTAGQAVAADLLTIGSPAPTLKVDTWVKGDPVSGIEKGKVYVIEFWGTTCVPCIKCMPHLSDLQRQHKAVIFACLSGEPEQTIRAFVAKNDNNMGFRVGVDGKGRMWKSWMEAAGLEGTPTAFIVDAAGKIAWIGNPPEMDEPLRQIVEGKYDPQLAIISLRFRQARTEAFNKEDERLDRGNRLAEQVEKLILEKKAAKAVALVDRAIQQEPGERVWYGQMKLQALVADPKLADKALEYGIELAAVAAARANHDMPTHQVLLHIASLLASPTSDAPPDSRCCDLAVEVVKCAQEVARQEKKLSAQSEVEWGIHTDSILAQVYAGKGEFDRAVTHAERALQSCRKALPPPSANEPPSAGQKQFRQDMENRAKMLEAYLADFKKKASTAPRK
jgi:thiol-disulfide isomerase/thioredoxin